MMVAVVNYVERRVEAHSADLNAQPTDVAVVNYVERRVEVRIS